MQNVRLGFAVWLGRGKTDEFSAQPMNRLASPEMLRTLAIRAIDAMLDSTELLCSVDHVKTTLHMLEAEVWTSEEWDLLAEGICGIPIDCHLMIHSGLDDVVAMGVLACDRITVEVSGSSMTLFDSSLLLLHMLNLNSRKVAFVLLRDDSGTAGLNRRCGKVKFNDLPHFTFEARQDLLWYAGAPDSLKDELIHLSDSLKLDRASVFRLARIALFATECAPSLEFQELFNLSIENQEVIVNMVRRYEAALKFMNAKTTGLSMQAFSLASV
jgi:hypothetical protein